MLRVAWSLCGAFLALESAPGRTAEPPSQQDFYCEQGATMRIVSIITTPGSDREPRGSCKVVYTKDHVTKTLWSASTGHGYCIKKATAFVTQLSEAHYSCSLKTREQPEK